MGCFGSREDSRRGAYGDDFNGLDFAFTFGGIKDVKGMCPVDWVVKDFVGDGKELKDAIGEITDKKMAEDKAKELGAVVFKAMVEYHDFLVDKYKGEAKIYGGKYGGDEAIEQMNGALTLFSAKCGLDDCKWPKPAEAPAGMGDKDAKDEEKPAEGDAAEGGEGEEAKPAEGEGEKKEGDAAPAGKPTPVFDEAAWGEFGGVTDLPKLLLALCFLYPVFGDKVKSEVMHWELDGTDKASFKEVAAISGAYVDANEKEDAASSAASWLTAEDLEALKEAAAAKETTALVFPGNIGAFADDETALAQAAAVDGRTQVLFQFGTGKVMKPAGDKLHVIHRQFSTIKELKEPAEGAKNWICVLEDFVGEKTETIGAWLDLCKKKAEEVGAAVEAGKEAVDAAKEGDDKPKEGEGEGEKPAE